MERHEVIDQLRALKLYGMVGVYDEAVTQGIRRNNSVQEILMTLCLAEAAERKARSIKYQLGIAKFPVHKNLDTFSFSEAQVNEALIKDLYTGSFLEEPRNIIFIGGTGTGKTHLPLPLRSSVSGWENVDGSSVLLIWSINLSRRNLPVGPVPSPAGLPMLTLLSWMSWDICLSHRQEVLCCSI